MTKTQRGALGEWQARRGCVMAQCGPCGPCQMLFRHHMRMDMSVPCSESRVCLSVQSEADLDFRVEIKRDALMKSNVTGRATLLNREGGGTCAHWYHPGVVFVYSMAWDFYKGESRSHSATSIRLQRVGLAENSYIAWFKRYVSAVTLQHYRHPLPVERVTATRIGAVTILRCN